MPGVVGTLDSCGVRPTINQNINEGSKLYPRSPFPIPPLPLSLSFHVASVSCRRWLCLAGHIRKRERERERVGKRERQQSRAEREAEQARRVCDLTVCDKFYFCSGSATSVYPCPLLLLLPPLLPLASAAHPRWKSAQKLMSLRSIFKST